MCAFMMHKWRKFPIILTLIGQFSVHKTPKIDLTFCMFWMSPTALKMIQ